MAGRMVNCLAHHSVTKESRDLCSDEGPITAKGTGFLGFGGAGRDRANIIQEKTNLADHGLRETFLEPIGLQRIRYAKKRKR